MCVCLFVLITCHLCHMLNVGGTESDMCIRLGSRRLPWRGDSVVHRLESGSLMTLCALPPALPHWVKLYYFNYYCLTLFQYRNKERAKQGNEDGSYLVYQKI